MEIILSNDFKLVSQESNWDVVEIIVRQKFEGKGKGAKPTGETYASEKIHAYNMPLLYCVEKVIHILNHRQQNCLTLQEFKDQYIVERKKLIEFLP